jgi:hypothetical protein
MLLGRRRAAPTPIKEPMMPAKTTTITTATTAVFEWPKKPAAVLLDYLKAEVTDAADAPNRAKPFINSAGVLHLHSTDWRAWLAGQGMEPTKSQAAAPLRAAGLAVRAYPLPREGRSLGFYTGPAPKGTDKLARRVVQRASAPRRPFAKLTEDERSELAAALTARPAGETRDALLILLAA